MSPASETRPRPIRGVLLDLDGTLYLEDAAIPGGAEAVRALREQDIPCRFVTNTTRVDRAGLAERLGRLGIEVDRDELFTAPLAAAQWLRDHDVRQVALYLPEAAHSEFLDFEVRAPTPDAVVIGDLGPSWTFELLNRAFRQLLDGATLVALQKNRFWRTPDGLTLDAGPFVAALEYASNVVATVVGKPAPEFFHLAADALGVPRDAVIVVGDDLESDVGGAQKAGLRGVLVRTGKFRPETLQSSLIEPEAVLDSVAHLPRWIRKNAGAGD
jgi:HAD superfamily hydrolase (TIGR01458 family)